MGSPELAVDLLAEVVDAWVFTVQQRRGIFSRSVSEQGMLYYWFWKGNVSFAALVVWINELKSHA